MMTTLRIEGADRDVLMQASKNGFFYVLDRGTGALLAADKFVDVNWASGVDLKSGRPLENPEADYTQGKPVIVFPSAVGAHNFNPMSLSGKTGLVYIPAVHSGMALVEKPVSPYEPQRNATGVQVALATQLLQPTGDAAAGTGGR
ncbi:MAG: hypothetical protein WDM77_10285 [Steroidobacteraceae bacterium]